MLHTPDAWRLSQRFDIHFVLLIVMIGVVLSYTLDETVIDIVGTRCRVFACCIWPHPDVHRDTNVLGLQDIEHGARSQGHRLKDI